MIQGVDRREREKGGEMARDSGGDCAAPLLEGREIVEGMLDYKGMKAVRSSTGGWRSAGFIIGVEMAERFAFYGISANLITYLTGPLRQSTAVAAVNVNAWSGAVCILPLVGAFVADSYLGRYHTILYSSLLYVMGLGLVTLSAFLSPIDCQATVNTTTSCPPPSPFQVFLFFSSLYIVAAAQGGHKPCTQAFGADQFNGQDPRESTSRGSFFNWWFFGLCWGTIFAFTILTYIQDNFSWALGFGLPCISMGIALFAFLLGTKTYRYTANHDERNPFFKIGQVFVVAAKNWRSPLPSAYVEEEGTGQSHQFKFLEKALIDVHDSRVDAEKVQIVCSVTQVEDAKSILQLVPIWCACFMYGVVVAQTTTFFTKQGSTMDRSLGPSLHIPPASLLTSVSLSITLFIPVYDFAVLPIARFFTNKSSGITMLQRIGFGMILSVTSMVVAALVEKTRLQTAFDFGLVDDSGATVPMSIWWLLPQYCLIGIGDVFTMVGLQEFMYDQVPKELKSLGIALYWSIFGIGSFISGFFVSVLEKLTNDGQGDSWFSNNLNRGHLDYFYWFLAGLSAIVFVVYLHFARLYTYNQRSLS